MLSILKPSISFFISYDCVICDYDKYHASVTYDVISHSLFIFKINKIK